MNASAAEWSAAPDAGIIGTYNDNILLSTDPKVSVFGTLLDLRADLGVRSERSALVVTPRLRFSRYPGEAGLNSNDLFLALASSHTFERGELALDANIIRDTTLTSELLTTGRVVEGDRRNSVDVRPSLEYAISERTAIDLGYRYTTVDYQEPPVTTRLFDYDYQIAEGQGTYRLSERDDTFTTLFASDFDVPDLRSTTRSYGALLGYARALSESLSGSLALGAARSNVEFAGPSGREDDSSIDPVWDARLTKKYEWAVLDAHLSRGLFPSGDGVLLRRDQLDMSVGARFSALLRGHATVFAFRNRSLQNRTRVVDRDVLQVSIGIARQLSPHWALSGEYRFTRSEPKSIGGSAESNAVLIRLNYSGRKWAMSR